MVANNRAFLLSKKLELLELYQKNWQNFQQASAILEREQIVTEPEQKQRFEEMKKNWPRIRAICQPNIYLRKNW